jgi:hypothetical protein
MAESLLQEAPPKNVRNVQWAQQRPTTDDHLWLVTFMDYDLGYYDDETCRLEPIDNPFGSKLLPMSPE